MKAEVGSWRRRANENVRRMVKVKEQTKWKKNSQRSSADDAEETPGNVGQISGRRIARKEVKKKNM